MKFIGARLTVLYALSVTALVAVACGFGYSFLERQLAHGLDRLDFVHFQEIKARLGNHLENLGSDEIERRLRDTSEYLSPLFYIAIENSETGAEFRSRNLAGRAIPIMTGEQAFFAVIEGAGEARINEFMLPPFHVAVATPTHALRNRLTDYVRLCGILLLALLPISLGIGFGLSRVMVNPIRLISETANRIRSDNLSERIPVTNVGDELSDLASLLNQMFDRLEAAFDKVRRFSDEASHELKTPLSLIRLHAEKMLGDGDLSQPHTEAVLVQLEELARLNRIIEDLLFLSRAEAEAIEFNLQPQDPQGLLEGFNQDAIALSEHYGCRFAYWHEGSGVAVFEERRVRQVLLNVLSNALNVSPLGGSISLRSQIVGGVWRVSIEDEGPGIAVDQRERIFERFVRFPVPNGRGGGNGLGLAICHSIIELHRGRIFADAGSGGQGLRVTFEIPALRSGVVSAAPILASEVPSEACRSDSERPAGAMGDLAVFSSESRVVLTGRSAPPAGSRHR